MKALSVRQPWAYAIAHLGKRVENRTWNTAYRGPIAIHASKTVDDACMELVANLGGVPTEQVKAATAAPWRGAFVAIADLVGVCECGWECTPWAAYDQYHLQLANVRPLNTPVPARGSLGLRRIPDDLAALIEEASCRQIVTVPTPGGAR